MKGRMRQGRDGVTGGRNLCVMLEVIVSLALFLVCNGCCFLMAPQHFEPVNEDIQLLKIS